MDDQKISRIFGMETGREGEWPQAFIVGDKHGLTGYTVTSIVYEVTNYGDHGIGWFVVMCDDLTIAKMQARAVAEIHYTLPELEAA